VHEFQVKAADLVARVIAGRTLRDDANREAPPCHATVRNLVLGTLRWLGTQRAIGSKLARKGFFDPRLESLVCVALFQLQHSNAAPHVIVDEAVKAARVMGFDAASGFVNGVLRQFLRDSEALIRCAQELPEGRWNHPKWWVEKLRHDHPNVAEAILSSAMGHPPMTLRVNVRRVAVSDYLKMMERAGIDADALGKQAILLKHAVPTASLPGFKEGLVSVQDSGAQNVAALLGATDGQRVLDACVAPGGKAAHVLEQADVDLLGIDVSAVRLESVRAALSRLGLSAHLIQADAANTATWWDGRSFDRVLVDAPCSGSGIVRRHPDAKWLRRKTDLPKFACQQMALLRSLWHVVAPGGRLLYVTCSVFPDENEAVIEQWLANVSDAERIAVFEPTGVDGYLFPTSQNDGFFFAMFTKH